MARDLTSEENFAAYVLELKKRNHSFTPAKIADKLQSDEVHSELNRAALRVKIWRILRRGTAKRKQRTGNVKTVRTELLQMIKS